MGEFVGKLTNLSYEFFGVVLPGVIAHLFLFVVWAALGPLAPVISYDTIPTLRLADLVDVIDSMTTNRGIGALILLVIGWYFLGHLVLWISRSRERPVNRKISNVERTWLALTFRTARPQDSYEPKLQPLFDEVKKEFEKSGIVFEWRHFYPVAKNFLAQNVAYSLVATYQHKYTLHRSITTASALLFWLLTAISLIGEIGTHCGMPAPSWRLLLFAGLGAILLVWGFSGSYMYNWRMFGDTIITECYALLKGPKACHGSKPPNSH